MADETTDMSRKDRKRTEIVAIAQELFFQQGYAETSMSQIAKAVGGSKTTLYNHFQSKEDLLLAVINDVVEPAPDDYDTGTMPTEFEAWLAWFGKATVRRITSDKYVALQRLAAGEALRFPEIGRLFYEVGVSPGYRMIAQSFAQAMESGTLRHADPNAAAEMFVEMCLGWMSRRVVWNIQPAPTAAEIETAVQNAISVFMDGYAAR